ncbi:MAG: divalent metal cation transporter [Candidatus Fraserbacteria bacterium RBG_16_55_9]|uniref:Divalent metal cation transporter n=1 Tax=Fraserbacteria sp. (strain RBG_16_55_9) TaxID=1817864 RepID=A0A1F5V184_FRAXR|nr:MAG: divalent metal cation transporter [Candidatus Fraserbacteria bacterium RBG_16_55_9]
MVSRMVTPKRPFWFYLGPAFLVSVGYMDPGNWATDIAAGSQYGYSLLWVVTLASAMAILMQILAAKLGVATGRDLAETMRERFSPLLSKSLFVTAAIAMMATDLAEFLGVAIALNLLFGIPLLIAVFLTVFDVLLILWLERYGYRIVEIVIIAFVATIGWAYVIELFLAKPDIAQVATNLFIFNPAGGDAATLLLVMGIIGATVMPHNLFLHSSQVKTRQNGNSDPKKRIVRWAIVDTIVALGAAWLVNAAIMIMSAAAFHSVGLLVTDIDQAYLTLVPLLGKVAAVTFAIALLASGTASSTMGTLAGQVVFMGFFNLPRVNLAVIRLGTRVLTMLPATIAILLSAKPLSLLVLSQVILSMQLPFAVIPLVRFTSDRTLMGELVNRPWVTVLAWMAAGLIVVLNMSLLVFSALGM